MLVSHNNNKTNSLPTPRENLEKSDINSEFNISFPRSEIFTDLPEDLRQYIGGKGHVNFPCLSKVYSESSLILCMDFTPWIIKKIRMNDLMSVKKFIYSVKSSSPGISSSWDDFKKETDLDKILSIDFTKLTSVNNVNFVLELKAILILVIARLGLKFHRMIDQKVNKYLARTLYPYNILHNENYKSLSDTNTTIYKKLVALPTSSRAHFFDILERHSNKYFLTEQSTFYLTREYGIDEKLSIYLLIDSKLVKPCNDIEISLSFLTKENLAKKFQTTNEYPPQSWKKGKIVNYYLTSYPDLSKQISNELQVNQLNSELISLIPKVQEQLFDLENYFLNLLKSINHQ